METIGKIVYFAGLIACIAGSIWMLVLAFQESVLWGLGCLFIPFVGLVFLIMHWPATKNPLFVYVGGLVGLVLGTVLGPSG
ncbi:MAG: hypothetical protein U0804_19015 [Gemmataceae bacterium]